MSRGKKIYLDYAASTPVDARVERAMRPYFSEKFGNPGSLHSFGREAIAAVDESREIVAKAINAGSGEIIFTGSATEANNLALRGIADRFKNYDLGFRNEKFIDYKSKFIIPQIIVSAIEHESVLETAEDLSAGGGKDGVEVVYLPVHKNGLVDLAALKKSLNERTILVSVMCANNEIGTIQPISEIAGIIRDFRKQIANRTAPASPKLERGEQRAKNEAPRFAISALPLFHSDAAQAFQFLDCDVEKLGVDLLALSSHKIYGPKGVGALYVRRQIANRKSQIDSRYAIGALPLAPLTTGGGQEFGLRSGTENVPAIVGFARAAELILKSREKEAKRISGLKNYFWKELRRLVPNAELNGAQIAKSVAQRVKNDDSRLALCALPNILNVYFPHRTSEYLLTKFDINGLAASSGSACRSRALSPSYVVKALGHSEKRAKHSVRFSFGRPTTKSEIKKALAIIKKCLR